MDFERGAAVDAGGVGGGVERGAVGVVGGEEAVDEVADLGVVEGDEVRMADIVAIFLEMTDNTQREGIERALCVFLCFF